jgi:hypothetical protein
MKGILITNYSKTINKNAEKYLDYYSGSFKTINKIYRNLSLYLDMDVYIFTEKLDIVNGNEKLIDRENSINKSIKFINLIKIINNYDVIVILLKTDFFEKFLINNLDLFYHNINRDSILCMTLSKHHLNKIYKEILNKKNVETIIYQSCGVARLNKKSFEKLLNHVIKKYKAKNKF